MYERHVRPWLFRLDAERAHGVALAALRAAALTPGGLAILRRAAGPLPLETRVEVLGLRFPSPIGLAAGFDKDAVALAGWAALGFGFIEIGSVTLQPQSGNPKPRLFRLPEHEAVINRMGFNSAGTLAAKRRLLRKPEGLPPLGINLGLNAGTPADEAPRRYAETFAALEPFGDYFAVNVSSPNTTGLRDLQERLRLGKILDAIAERNPERKPILVKLAPDLSDEQLEDLLPVIEEKAQGVIATNTTVSREGLPSDLPELRGGLSGAPLRPRSTAVIKKIYTLTHGRLPIVGVGGVMSGADALEKIAAGASLVQIYTGLVYRGPALAARSARELAVLMRGLGAAGVADLVGREAAP